MKKADKGVTLNARQGDDADESSRCPLVGWW